MPNEIEYRRAFGAALLMQLLLYLLREVISWGITALFREWTGYLYLQRVVFTVAGVATFVLPCFFYLKYTRQGIDGLLYPWRQARCRGENERSVGRVERYICASRRFEGDGECSDGSSEQTCAFSSAEKRKKTCPVLSLVFKLSGAALVLNAVNLVGMLTDTVVNAVGGSMEQSVFPNSVALAVMTFVSTVLFTPVIEELLFRGVALNALLPCGRIKAVIASGFFFALMHCRLYLLPYAFCAGCLIAVYALKENSLLYAVFLHFVNNLITFLNLAVGHYFGEAARVGFATVTLFVSLPFAVIGAIRLGVWLTSEYRDRDSVVTGRHSVRGCDENNVDVQNDRHDRRSEYVQSGSCEKNGGREKCFCGEMIFYAILAFAICVFGTV